MEMSNITSKTSALKALLLKAWKERWTDIQWGINIKLILPRGVSGDVYNLADCMLQHALIGAGANELVLSYLKHTLSCQLVSYAAVLQKISKFTDFQKPHCIISLLEFLESIQAGITSRNKSEESLLACAVFSTVHWLLNVYHHAISDVALQVTSPPEKYQIPYPELLEKPAQILTALVASDFMTAMLYLAKHDDHGLYLEITKICAEISSLLASNTGLKPQQLILKESLQALCTLDIPPFLEQSEEPITYCIQPLLAVEVLLNPSSDTQKFVNEMLMIQRIKNYSNARLYCELIRACLMSLINVSGTAQDSMWGAFTFLKVPTILEQLYTTRKSASDKLDYSTDVVEAFELLLQNTALLDYMDSKSTCNTIECLLVEMHKHSLVTDVHVKTFSARREPTTETLKGLGNNTSQAPIPKVIRRAEPTLAGILKTLNADYVKIQDALLSMLCQVLTGKSFELILAVATVQGKLKQFVSKLIKFNESSKQIVGEVGKPAQTKAHLFDVSFLMLCSIVQTYGSDVVLDEKGDSFFEQWVKECMVERGKPKSPDQMIQNCDPVKVDALLMQFNAGEADFKNSQIKLYEVCLHIGSAVKEVLWAWEQGSLSPNDVKRILDAMRGRMCSLSVCAVAWLCSYMQIVQQDALLKPRNMVQQFLTTLTTDETAQADHFKERSGLMFQVIRKMQYDVHPPTASQAKVMTVSHSIISNQPILYQLQNVWTSIHKKGWLPIEDAHTIESLLTTGSPVWFVTNLVKEIMKFRYQESLEKGVDLAFAMFHLNIEQCTQALLLQVLPMYLYSKVHSQELVEPQSSIIAKLTVYCVLAALEYSHINSIGSKRSREADNEDIEALCPTNKVRLLNDNTTETSTLFPGNLPNQNNNSSVVLKEPLLGALQELFKTFALLAGQNGEVTQQTYFIFMFLKFLVQSGKERSAVLLQVMPDTLVPALLRTVPDQFTTSLLVQMYDVNTLAGRKAIASDLCLMQNTRLRSNAMDL